VKKRRRRPPGLRLLLVFLFAPALLRRASYSIGQNCGTDYDDVTASRSMLLRARNGLASSGRSWAAYDGGRLSALKEDSLYWQCPVNPLHRGHRSWNTATVHPPINSRESSSRHVLQTARSGNEPLNLRSIVLLSACRPSPELATTVKTSANWPARLSIEYTRFELSAVGVEGA
jgi:hypothetical protein